MPGAKLALTIIPTPGKKMSAIRSASENSLGWQSLSIFLNYFRNMFVLFALLIIEVVSIAVYFDLWLVINYKRHTFDPLLKLISEK